jgi:protein-disulfide isomerase
VLDDYVRTGKVKLEFRGMAFVGPESEAALRAVAAAGQQNKLWSLTHLLYMNQGMENSGWVTKDFLRDAAHSVPGLDAGRALDSANSDEVTRELARMQGQADRDGINSTPSFLVGPSGGTLEPLDVKTLDAEAFTSAFDKLLS